MKYSILSLVLILILLVGCDAKRAEKEPSEKQKPTPAAQDIAAPTTPASASKRVEVQLLPPTPTVSDPLQVVVTGCSKKMRYLWEVNGQEVEQGNNRPQLPVGLYHKNDLVSVRVTCGEQELSVSAEIRNSPPVIIQINRLAKVISGQPLEVAAEAVDPDGDIISFRYQWSVNGDTPLGLTEAILPGKYVQIGKEITVTVIPSDLNDDGSPYTSQPLAIDNAPPKFVSTPPVSFQTIDYRYQAIAKDPEGDKLTYHLEKGPEGMTISESSGEIVWPIKKGTAGAFEVSIVAQDSAGLTARQTYSIQLRQQETQP